MASVHQDVPGTVRFELRYNIPNNVIENVFYVKRGLALWTEAEMDTAEAAFVSWFTSDGSNYISDQLNLFAVQATDLTSLHGIRKAYAISPPLDGNLTGEYLPANVTIAVKASTGIRGRGTNGRIFWPALTAPQVTNQSIDTSAASNIVTALNNLKTAIAALGGGAALVVPHFMVGGVRPTTVDCDPIQQYVISDFYLDAQRLRLPAHRKAKKKKSSTP